jgi:hypothetical protein
MLQCFQYFKQAGAQIEFLAKRGEAAPDLKVTPRHRPNDAFYVECYVYSKWWFVEVFLEELITVVGSDLRLRRTFNLPGSTLSTLEKKSAFLHAFAAVLTANALARARSDGYPTILHEENDWQLVLGHFPRNNPQGAAAKSVPTFLKEIVGAKEGRNGLAVHHPNLLMANGLGPDFQLGFDHIDRASFVALNLVSIDAILAAACGIGSPLIHSDRRKFFCPQKEHPAPSILDSGVTVL